MACPDDVIYTLNSANGIIYIHINQRLKKLIVTLPNQREQFSKQFDYPSKRDSESDI